MSARIYDGSFDLAWLRDDETVSSAGDGSGACLVENSRGGSVRIEVGETVDHLLAAFRRHFASTPKGNAR